MNDFKERIEKLLSSTATPKAWVYEDGAVVLNGKFKSQLATYLAQELNGAIIPKFKVGQEVWLTNKEGVPEWDDTFAETVIEARITGYGILYDLDFHLGEFESDIFPTQAVAERALKSEVGK